MNRYLMATLVQTGSHAMKKNLSRAGQKSASGVIAISQLSSSPRLSFTAWPSFCLQPRYRIAFAKLPNKIPFFRQYCNEMHRQERYRSENGNPKIVQHNSKPPGGKINRTRNIACGLCGYLHFCRFRKSRSNSQCAPCFFWF